MARIHEFTDEVMKMLDKMLDEKFDEKLVKPINERLDRLDVRFDRIESKLDMVSSNLGERWSKSADLNFSGVDEKLDTAQNILDRIKKNLSIKEESAEINKGGEDMDKEIKELYLEIINEQKAIQNRLDTMNYTINNNSKNIEKIIQALNELSGNILSHGDYCEERFDHADKRYLALKQELALYKIREESKELDSQDEALDKINS